MGGNEGMKKSTFNELKSKDYINKILFVNELSLRLIKLEGTMVCFVGKVPQQLPKR